MITLQLYPDFFESFINTLLAGVLNQTLQDTYEIVSYVNGLQGIMMVRLDLLRNL
jgi:hypothetical protein